MGLQSLNPGRSRQLALAASIALHGAVLVSVSQTRGTALPALPEGDAVVVWLSDWQPPEAHSIDEDPAEPTDLDLGPSPDVKSGPVAEDEPEPEPTAPAQVAESAQPSPGPPPKEREPTRPTIDWEADMMRAIVRMREESSEADAYLTFSYPERRRQPARGTGGDSTMIAGVVIPPDAPCVQSVRSFLGRLLLPVDVCDWHTRERDSYLTRDQRDTLASLSPEFQENRRRRRLP